jgi:excinuclease ABC subunit A
MRIAIRGASENNLQHLDVDFSNGLTVVTGVSGSGKTSLVFDTLYHEARRRFLESFTSGASALRLSPAAVQSISGLGPAVAVGQNLLNRNPGSTLATASGLHPFLRLLYARFGERLCAGCGANISRLSEDELVERVVALTGEKAYSVFAPLLHGAVGSHRTLLELLGSAFGAQRLRVDGQAWEGNNLDLAQAHDIEIELAEAVENLAALAARELIQQAAALGVPALLLRRDGEEWALSRAPVCARCGRWFGDLQPVHFLLPCTQCQGRGCAACDGSGMQPEAAATRWQGLRLNELLRLSVSEMRELFRAATQGGLIPSTAERLREEIERRLEALDTVGLGYIGLDRSSPTLSRGEAQRVRLAVSLTSRLEDMLHVLDEPTVGQHPADVARLLPAFRKLSGPVVYVEHDRAAAAVADHAIDLGPGAGSQGGRLLFSGTPAELWQSDTPTGRYFSLRERGEEGETGRGGEERLHGAGTRNNEFLVVRGASLRNLKGMDVSIPLGRLTVISGVSGSGKSTFVEDVLVPSLNAGRAVGCSAIEGPKLQPVMVDQSPIGINPRSNPATYTGLADVIRDLFAAESGLSPSHFSFNRPEGACPTCKGMGAVEVQMRYLPSTWIPCADCDGQRFSEDILAERIRFGEQELSIADFFRLSIAEALPLLVNHEKLLASKRRLAHQVLQALEDVGLGYLPLGQPSPTLSGGEAQRVKLARYLGERSLASELLILDEPSTGLHPQDIGGLLVVLHRLVRGGATIVVVEHNLDILRAADWIIDLGPGAGPEGGLLLYAGTPEGLLQVTESQTAQALREEDQLQPRAVPEVPGENRAPAIQIHGARANNLRNVSVDIPKSALTVVTGVSGSGKSSLVSDVLEAEARRRFLESLSMYERQGVREGPEAEVESVNGLGVAASIGTERRLHDQRATVGTVTDLTHHLAVLLSLAGKLDCLRCHVAMHRDSHNKEWICPVCGDRAPVGQPRHFLPNNYAGVCLTCHGVGTMQIPNPSKLIIHPELPLCDGAMFSPGFFPKGYLGKPFNGGYDMVQGLAEKYGFDPFTTPWNQMSNQAQQAFLFGDPEPMPVTFVSRTGRTHSGMHKFPGFYGWVRDWDVGGTYTDTRPCPACGGSRLRPEYARVRLAGQTSHDLNQAPLADLPEILQELSPLDLLLADRNELKLAMPSLQIVMQRLRFLNLVGLGYLHLSRLASSLSAGEAQRIRLAGLLGSELTALTVLLDEPTRGLHPSEVEALLAALLELRSAGNTVVVVEHEPLFMLAADHLIDMGPGAGVAGGRVVAQGKPSEVAQAETITAQWLRGERSSLKMIRTQVRRSPRGWMTIRGARANNLRGEDVRIPLGMLVGVCGVSGSGKSTLVMDTLGRALVPKKYTTSVAQEPVDPGEYDAIDGAPERALLIDQTRAGVTSPADFLGFNDDLIRLYAESDGARALGLEASALRRRCSACGGSGVQRIDMGFLPDVHVLCETCGGTGFLPEAWQVRLGSIALPECFALTIDEVFERFGDQPALAHPLSEARAVGLGYLVLRQPGYSLSGGEAQRLKIASELAHNAGRKASGKTLYILDEPTVGQHMEDVARLVGVLHRLVEAGHTVLVVEHHPHLLAACDWLIELGPGGGPRGGWVIAGGAPEELARGSTPTARYLREIFEGKL